MGGAGLCIVRYTTQQRTVTLAVYVGYRGISHSRAIIVSAAGKLGSGVLDYYLVVVLLPSFLNLILSFI